MIRTLCALATFLAGRFNLLQAMSAWRSGGFSSIVRGFYEPLWAVLGVAVITWIAADRFSVAGMGREVATNVGLDYNRTVLLGTTLVALSSHCAGVPEAGKKLARATVAISIRVKLSGRKRGRDMGRR